MTPVTTRVFEDGARVVQVSLVAAAVGAVAMTVGVVVAPTEALGSYLIAYAFVASIAAGALIFLMIVHAMNATWPVAIRRLVETITSAMPLVALLFLPLVPGLSLLYPWLRVESIESEHVRELVAHRRPYLNLVAFLVRTGAYLAIWMAIAHFLRRWSLQRDVEPRAAVGARMHALSAGALPAVGLAMSFASIDWLMTLDVAWSSTMFPVYFFAGGFLAALALLTVLTFAADRAGLVSVSESHYYALGRLLLAFTIFWAYAAFFQLFLVWIANVPDEASFYLVRAGKAWLPVSVVLLVAHFVLPFAVLLNYRMKRRPAQLTAVAVWLLAAHYIDVHWLAAPTLRGPMRSYHWLDLPALLVVGGLCVAFATWRLRGLFVVPIHDPRIAQAQRYESS